MNSLEYLLVLLQLGIATAVTVEVLSPTHNSTVEAGLIITPGADIDGRAYRPLAEAIQKVAPIKLWVALLEDWPLNVPNPVELNGAVDEAIDKMGITNGNIFLAGHSLGGVFVGSYGLKNYEKLKGILLFASYLTKGNKLKDYPLPVLHISGDLDGLTRITRIIDTFEELLQNIETSGHKTMYHTPVIVMEGINHGHFASGTMPPNVKSHDLQAEMSYDSAHDVIAGHVSSFLMASLQQPASEIVEAEKALNTSHKETLAILKPLSVVKSWDMTSKSENDTTKRAQDILLGPKLADHVTVDYKLLSEEEMLTHEPRAVSDTKDHAQVQTYSHVALPFNPEDVSEFPQSPTEVQSKMMTKQDLMILLPNVTSDSSNNTCKEVNQVTFDKAIQLASARAHERYTSHGSPPIKFNPDIRVSFAVEWILSSLKLDYGSMGALDVTSYSYVIFPEPMKNSNDTNSTLSGVLTIIAHLKRKATYSQGYYYCKLLSPSRALEWYYIDALKKSTDS